MSDPDGNQQVNDQVNDQANEHSADDPEAGTRLEPQQKTTLQPGDVLKIGQMDFTLEWSQPEEA